MDRVTQRLWRGVEEPVLSVAEGTSAVLILSMQLGAFRPPKTDNKIRYDAHLMDRRRGRLCAKSATSPPAKPHKIVFLDLAVDNLSIDYLWLIAAIGRVLENAEETI